MNLSNCVLQPKDKKPRSLFVDFRCEQIKLDFTIWLVLQLVFLVVIVLCLIAKPDRAIVRFCISRLIQMVVLVLIVFISKSYKQNSAYIYLIPFCLLSSYLSLITICARETNDFSTTDWTVQE